VEKDQVSKHATGGFIPTGAFAISGKRVWYRGTRLALRIGLSEERLIVVPEVSTTVLDKELTLLPSKKGKGKGALAKSLAKRFSTHPDNLLEILPNGPSKTVQKG
jgi:hypothetical protein